MNGKYVCKNAHMAAFHDEMLDILLERQIMIMKVNPTARKANAPSHIPKPKMDWIAKDRRRNNLNNVAKDLLFKAVDDTIFSRIRGEKTARTSGTTSCK